jgi:hypothetical protein
MFVCQTDNVLYSYKTIYRIILYILKVLYNILIGSICLILNTDTNDTNSISVICLYCVCQMASTFYFRRTPPIDPEILRTMKMQGTIGYAPNPMGCRRNQVRFQILKNPSYHIL